jgi:hypothetical protein
MTMLKRDRQDIHRSKLPPPGAIGYIVGLRTVDPPRKCIVSHYPLCDSADYRYSIGIHTVWVRFLDNGEVARFSGFWFEELP